jgi:hypothetical protein
MNRARYRILLFAVLVATAVCAPAGSMASQIQRRPVMRTVRGERADLNRVDEWARRNWPGTYAGSYIVANRLSYFSVRHGGFVVAGFTRGGPERLREARALVGIEMPGRIVGFTRRPRYSLMYLEKIRREVGSQIVRNRRFAGLISSIGTEIRANQIGIATTKVRKVKRLILQRFGPGAPVRVYWAEPPVEI